MKCIKLLELIINSELTLPEKVTLAYYVGAARVKHDNDEYWVNMETLHDMCGDAWWDIIDKYLNL